MQIQSRHFVFERQQLFTCCLRGNIAFIQSHVTTNQPITDRFPPSYITMKFVDLLKCQIKRSNKILISRGKGNNWCHLRCRSLGILNTLSWETLDNRRKKSKAVFMYKVLNDHAVPGLKESPNERNVTHNIYNLRNSENDLILSKTRTEYLRRSFKECSFACGKIGGYSRLLEKRDRYKVEEDSVSYVLN